MRFFVVDLPSLFQRAVAPGAASAEPGAQLPPGAQGPARAAADSLQAVADLDGATLWPTHRIRCYLHSQPPARASHRRARQP
ncbi:MULTISPECIES: hypothetical protein [unclassified Acidovorax]|uniref:hypothetical protein n=1 Tax=unclassified Acidovorax TaxID=2684926 RepID=UPI0006F2FD70|nr:MULTISPECIES: hypothetical protein [unclassified Acidovorax]KRB35556.1 hypothetical protein ASD94_02820 [Acidovorax sp. Root70]PUA99189.1 hypothetical protein C8C99_4073 [Acidovorax sp. 107]